MPGCVVALLPGERGIGKLPTKRPWELSRVLTATSNIAMGKRFAMPQELFAGAFSFQACFWVVSHKGENDDQNFLVVWWDILLVLSYCRPDGGRVSVLVMGQGQKQQRVPICKGKLLNSV